MMASGSSGYVSCSRITHMKRVIVSASSATLCYRSPPKRTRANTKMSEEQLPLPPPEDNGRSAAAQETNGEQSIRNQTLEQNPNSFDYQMEDHEIAAEEEAIGEQSIRDQTLEQQNATPLDPEIEDWENRTRSWLSTLSKRRNVSMNEIEAWIVSNQVPLPEQLKSLPQPQLYQRVLSIHKLMRRPNQVKDGNPVEPSQARFQRTDQWIPVYSWLESLDKDEVVKSKEISDWLSENPTVKEKLYSRHSRYHLMHYVQKCHMKILKRRGKIIKTSRPASEAKFKSQGVKPSTSSTVAAAKVLSNAVIPPLAIAAPPNAANNALIVPSTTVAQPKIHNNGVATLALAVPLPCNLSSNLKASDKTSIKQDDAFHKYGLLTDLESQLISLLSTYRT